MVDHTKGGRNKLFQVLKTTFEFKEPLTLQAVKMMVVGFTAHLIARRLPRNFDRNKPSFIEQAFDRSIDRRHPQSRDSLLCKLQHLVCG